MQSFVPQDSMDSEQRFLVLRREGLPWLFPRHFPPENRKFLSGGAVAIK